MHFCAVSSSSDHLVFRVRMLRHGLHTLHRRCVLPSQPSFFSYPARHLQRSWDPKVMGRSTCACHFARTKVRQLSGRPPRGSGIRCIEEDDAVNKASRDGWPSDYDAQRKHRMSWMHWLHDKPKHARWAKEWQEAHQTELSRLETVHFGENCFVAESAHIFAEPGRDIVVGVGAHIGADVFLHGPVTLEEGVAVNARCHIDGGTRGVLIGKNTRLGPGCYMFAFNHGIDPIVDVKDQPVTSEGIILGQDCWLGASVCVTDGVRIGDHAVIGMGAVVTVDVPQWVGLGSW